MITEVQSFFPYGYYFPELQFQLAALNHSRLVNLKKLLMATGMGTLREV